MSYKSLFTDPGTNGKGPGQPVAKTVGPLKGTRAPADTIPFPSPPGIYGPGGYTPSELTPPVAIQYGAEAVLASLKLRPAPEHKGQTFDEFVSDVKARHPSTAHVAVPVKAKRGRGGKKGQKSERKPCREGCGNVAPLFSETGMCIVCEDKARMQKFAKGDTAQAAPVITCRASMQHGDRPGIFRETITYKGQTYEFDVNRRAKTGEPVQDYLYSEPGDEAATLTGDEYLILLNYAQGLIKRVEANDALCELARVKSMPERHFVSTHEERCEGLMREVMAQMPLSWLLTYIENNVGRMAPELRDAKFGRAK